MLLKHVKQINALCIIAIFFGNILDVSASNPDFENLSYGRDVLYGGAPVHPISTSTTPEPLIVLETTTKKSGFFSGIKNFFSRSSTETPPISSGTTLNPALPTKPTVPTPHTPLIPKHQHPIHPTPANSGLHEGGHAFHPAPAIPTAHTPLIPKGQHPIHPTTANSGLHDGGHAFHPESAIPTAHTPLIPKGQHPIHPTTANSGLHDGGHAFHPASAIPTAHTPLIPKHQHPIHPTPGNNGFNEGGLNFHPTPSGQDKNSDQSHLAVHSPIVNPGSVTPPNTNKDGRVMPTGTSSRRDYINPNVGPTNNGGNSLLGVHSPVINPGSVTPATGISSPQSSITGSSKRDYVAVLPTTTPSRRDYVNPNIPTAKSPTQPIGLTNPLNVIHPNQPINNGRRDYVNPNIGGQTQNSDYPTVPSTKKPVVKEDFPALPAPRKPFGGSVPRPAHSSPTPPNSNSVWSKMGSSSTEPNRVNFVPHQPGSTDSITVGTGKRPLATDDEIAALTEQLLSKDTNNQNKHVTINLQGKTRSTDRTDEAPNKLLQVEETALQTPTIAKMRLLFNNYEMDTLVNEYVTPIERKEENDFLDAVMSTQVMRQAMQFLQSKGLVTPDPKTHRDLVKTIWFTLYSRGQGRIGSSAFEHVFLSEIKNGSVIGLHNWVFYNDEEQSGHINYKGYIKKLDLGTKGSILKFRFDLNGIEKPVNALFIGTSPELELALYTVCFEVRPDIDCPISLNGNKLNIVTHTWRYRGKSLIGSAYPEI